MPSLNQVTTKCCIWQNCNCYVMIMLLPYTAKITRQIFEVVPVLN